MRKQELKGEPFFFYYSLIILTIVACAFGANALINSDDLPPILPIVIVHGIFMLAWYILVVVQTRLIIQRNHDIHIILGKASIVLAVGIVASGIMMTLDSYARSSRVDIVTVNLFITINFIILYTLAIYRRRHSDKHKRLILFASIAMILPALGRITQAASINDFLSLPMWLILMLAPVLYDIKTLRRVHKTTLLGIGLIIIGMALTISLMDYSIWVRFLESTIGKG
ncbi:MAG: hypothetical protein ACI8P3_002097 [Saprospiraceae bacterium]|jgi:hypothetical protein